MNLAHRAGLVKRSALAYAVGICPCRHVAEIRPPPVVSIAIGNARRVAAPPLSLTHERFEYIIIYIIHTIHFRSGANLISVFAKMNGTYQYL